MRKYLRKHCYSISPLSGHIYEVAYFSMYPIYVCSQQIVALAIEVHFAYARIRLNIGYILWQMLLIYYLMFYFFNPSILKSNS